MKKILFLMLSAMTWLASLMVYAQPAGMRGMKIVAEGTVVDSKSGEPLISAAVKVTSADGGTGTFGIADEEGHFTFEVSHPGKYTLEISYVSYKTLTREVTLFPGRGGKLGTFRLEEDPRMLGEVETVGRSQRVQQRGDTIVYNADAYKVADGATAEELIGKMPGLEVTNEGVKAQGETVEKITVDGKAFFENDPKLALRTLPAEVVQSVSVFDRRSDQAEFTGFDDGNTVKAMDLTTKAYRRNGVFGRVYGGVGADGDFGQAYWNGGFNVNVFNGDQRFSLLGMTNNVNQQNFSFDDLMQSGGMGGGPRGGMGARTGSTNGVSRANAFGLNFNDSYFADKLTVQGSYFYNQLRTQLSDSTFDDYINQPRATIADERRLSHQQSHRLDMRISYKPTDRDELMLRPSFNYQTNDADGLASSTTWRLPLDSVLLNPWCRTDATTWQSSSRTRSLSDSHNWNVGGSLLWRHRFATAGRTLSMEANGQLSGSASDADYTKSVNQAADAYQRQTSDQHNYRWGGNLQYTESLGQHSQLSVRYDISGQRSTNDRDVSYFDDADFLGLARRDTANTSSYVQRTLRQGAQLAWRLHTESLNLTAGLTLQHNHLEGEQDYFLWDVTRQGADPSYTTSRNYLSLLPNLRMEWRSEGGTQMQLEYRASASNPSISNLQQSVNTSNELAYSTGNADLDQSIDHSIRLRLIHSNMETATNFMVFGQYNVRQDYIGTQYLTNNSTQPVDLPAVGALSPAVATYADKTYAGLRLLPGARISRPVNMGGSQSARLGVTYGFPFDLLLSNVNASLDGSFSTTPSQQLYYDVVEGGQGQVRDLTTRIMQWSLGPRLHVSSNISADLDFSLMYQPNFQWVRDTHNDANNYNYLTHRAEAKLNWTFWRGFTTGQTLSFASYGGSSMSSSVRDWVWNMEFGKKFLKGNKAEVKLQVFDVLATRSGYQRSVSDSYVRASYHNIMPRYAMLTFTYKLASYRGSSELKERQRGGRGGFGGGRGF